MSFWTRLSHITFNMRALVVFALIIGSGFAAPVEDVEHLEDIQKTEPILHIEDIEELQRTKKSSYGPSCGGAAPFAPVALYLGPSQPQQPHYREIEHEEEDLKARSFYDASLAGLAGANSYGSGLNTAIVSSGGSYAAPISGASHSGASSGGYSGASSGSYGAAGGHAGASSSYSGASAALSGGYGGASIGGYSGIASGAGSHGSAIGVFPNAHISGCNVPLLLSCGPNIVSGHLAESHSYAPAPAYRSFEEDMRKEAEWAVARKAEWVQERKASHHKVSEDYPLPKPEEHHPINHHVVSEDYPKSNVVHIEKHPIPEPVKKN